MNTTNQSENSKKSGTFDTAAFQEKIMTQIRELGDTLERAGEKVEANGWETIGQAIYKLGNTLEHLKGGKSVQSDQSVGSSKPYTDQEFDEKSKKFSGSSSEKNASSGSGVNSNTNSNLAGKSTSVDKIGGNDSQAY